MHAGGISAGRCCARWSVSPEARRLPLLLQSTQNTCRRATDLSPAQQHRGVHTGAAASRSPSSCDPSAPALHALQTDLWHRSPCGTNAGHRNNAWIRPSVQSASALPHCSVLVGEPHVRPLSIDGDCCSAVYLQAYQAAYNAFTPQRLWRPTHKQASDGHEWQALYLRDRQLITPCNRTELCRAHNVKLATCCLQCATSQTSSPLPSAHKAAVADFCTCARLTAQRATHLSTVQGQIDPSTSAEQQALRSHASGARKTLLLLPNLHFQPAGQQAHTYLLLLFDRTHSLDTSHCTACQRRG
jgi:hypothetical protein